MATEAPAVAAAQQLLAEEQICDAEHGGCQSEKRRLRPQRNTKRKQLKDIGQLAVVEATTGDATDIEDGFGPISIARGLLAAPLQASIPVSVELGFEQESATSSVNAVPPDANVPAERACCEVFDQMPQENIALVHPHPWRVPRGQAEVRPSDSVRGAPGSCAEDANCCSCGADTVGWGCTVHRLYSSQLLLVHRELTQCHTSSPRPPPGLGFSGLCAVAVRKMSAPPGLERHSP